MALAGIVTVGDISEELKQAPGAVELCGGTLRRHSSDAPNMASALRSRVRMRQPARSIESLSFGSGLLFAVGEGLSPWLGSPLGNGRQLFPIPWGHIT